MIALPNRFTRACARTAARTLLAVLTAAGLLLPHASPAAAAPVRTALVAPAGDGAWRFFTDLAELWRNRYEPTAERLTLRTMAGAERRLRAVSRDRGDLAVVTASTAAQRLADYPRLTAIAVLWPNLLHAVSRNPRVDELKLPIPAELWALDSADFALRMLRELTRNARAQQQLLNRVPDTILVDALNYAKEPLLLFTAPAPLAELSDAQRRDPSLQVLPISGKLTDELKLAYPWLVTGQLGRGAYPALERNLELPAVYEVLVGRRDLPSATVRKVLDTVYGRSNAMALFDPLFGQTDARMNAVFGKLMPFHPVTAQRYSFTPAVP